MIILVKICQYMVISVFNYSTAWSFWFTYKLRYLELNLFFPWNVMLITSDTCFAVLCNTQPTSSVLYFSVGCRQIQDLEIPCVEVDPCGDAQAAAEGAVLGLHEYNELKQKKKPVVTPQLHGRWWQKESLPIYLSVCLFIYRTVCMLAHEKNRKLKE